MKKKIEVVWFNVAFVSAMSAEEAIARAKRRYSHLEKRGWRAERVSVKLWRVWVMPEVYSAPAV